MTRSLTAISALSMALVLLGLGCQTAEPVSYGTKDDAATTETASTADSTSTDTDTVDEEAASGEIVAFTAEPLGNNQVQLRWEVASDVEPIDGFRIIRSKNPDPVYDRMNYWWETPGYRRDSVWRGVEAGDYYMRLCIVRSDECVEYSENLMVNVR